MESSRTEDLPSLPPDTNDEGTGENGTFPELDPPPPGTIRYIDIHVYDQPAEEAEEEKDPAGIESTLAEHPTVLLEQDEQNTPPRRPRRRRQQGSKHVPFLFAGVLLLMIVALLVGTLLLPLFAPTATVMIIPVGKEISTTTTIAVTLAPAGAPGQLAGRVLPTITMSQAESIQTTGTIHEEARVARGLVVFYNAAPYTQTVGAGTVLTGASGHEIVTDQDAVLPAAVYPQFGQATVTAHTVTTGPAGNLQAGDIYGPCCRVNISAVNTAFRGGQPARDSRTVTRQDIARAVTSLSASLQQSIYAAVQSQVQPAETLITPLSCTQTVTPEHPAGSEATEDQITVTTTCRGITFSTQAYQRMTNAILAQQAQHQLGEGYTLTGTPQSTSTQVTTKGVTLTLLHVRVMGTYVYQFTQEQQAHLKALIAGKTKAQAVASLLNVPGVQSASLTLNNGGTLPTNRGHIHLVFLVMG